MKLGGQDNLEDPLSSNPSRVARVYLGLPGLSKLGPMELPGQAGLRRLPGPTWALVLGSGLGLPGSARASPGQASVGTRRKGWG